MSARQLARRLVGSLVPLFLVSTLPAASFVWKSRFTAGSSPDLARIHEAVYAADVERLRAVPVSGLIWSEPDFEMRLESGSLYVESPIEGATTGAFFEGRGTISFTPGGRSARAALRMSLNRESLDRVPVGTVYIFTLDPDSPLNGLAASAAPAPAAPSRKEVYLADKSAMRQLGLEITTAFLDRETVSKGSAYFLFPMQEIRTPRSEEARLMYRFNPMLDQDVSLEVFGHEEVVDFKPFKFKFYDVASYDTDEGSGMVDLERSSVRIALGTGAKEAQQEATLRMRVPAGLKALRLNLAIQMKVSGVAGPDGSALPFLQWEKLANDPDFDETILVALPETPPGAAQGSLALSIKSSGVLFEPWGGSFYLVNEDDWAPRPPSVNDEAEHELELTLPRSLTGIGIGSRTREETNGATKRVSYRTTQPVDQSTLYYGDYTRMEETADAVKLELYQARTDVQEQKNARFTITEIANALKVFNRMFVPLEIENLRVASTRTSHGRGFEGLLLLGGGGTSESSASVADIFRAHEVAHQWWGNYVRVKRWPQDRWLSEAFAEYSAMEYYKVRFPDPKKALEVMREQWYQPLTDGALKLTALTGEEVRAIGRTIYPLAAGTNNVYTKGPLVIGMLRYLFSVQKNNDEEFSAMLKDFLQTYRYQAATTADFQKIAEKHFGQGLGWFFDQWVEDGGLPILRWNHQIREESGSWMLDLKAAQEQKKYRLVVPIYIRFPGDKLVVRPWLIEGESGSRTIKLPARPESISLNDGMEALVILKEL